MIRAALALGVAIAGVTAWHVADVSSAHYGGLFLLAVALGFMLGILAAVAWVTEGAQHE